jgi:ribosomal protein L17
MTIELAGGYTRLTKLGQRSGTGDAAEMAVIEFI